MTQGILAGEDWVPLTEIKDRARRLATVLDRSGVGAGQTIGVLLGNRPEFIEAVFAARYLGASPIPMSPRLTPGEIGYLLADAAPAVVLAGLGLSERVKQADSSAIVITAGGDEFDSLLANTPPWRGHPRQGLEPMLYTSGTTGKPKGVRKSRATAEQNAALAAWSTRLFGAEPGMRTVLAAPLYHSAGYGYAMLVLAHSGLVVLEERFDAERLLHLIERHQISHLQLVPTMMHRLLALPAETRQRYDVSSLLHVMHGAGPCAPDTKYRMIQWWGPIIHEYYGSTETGALVACDSAEWLAHPGTVGTARDGAIVRVLDEDGVEVPAGTVGTVYGRHPSMPDFAYHGDPHKRRRIQQGDLVTAGDLGYLDDEDYLYIVSRRTDLILCGGVNIYPAEIEHELLQMPGIRDCVVVGVDDDEHGQIPVAVVEVDKQPGPTLSDLHSFLADRLARPKMPRRLQTLSSLPRDDNGKIRRASLVEQLARRQ